MGTLLDTTVFIELERVTRVQPSEGGMARVIGPLEAQLGEGEEVGIAAITASELLHGVHRASDEHRGRREAFVETVLSAFPVLSFDLLVARIHARLWASLAAAGTDVGAHDRLVAATAVSAGWRLVTANTRHFEVISGLDVVSVQTS